MYIFLDFDGVLKPVAQGNTPNIFNRDCLDTFENVVRLHDNIKIVISSTWKLVYSLKNIRLLFSEDIQPLVVGMTPDSYGQITPYERHKEVLAYLKQNNDEDCNWVAIDDDPEHYPKECTVILTDSYIGFTHTSALELSEVLEHQSL